MKKLDLYIIKKFLTTFAFMLGIIMSIAIIFDISEKIDDFIKKEAPLQALVLDYYINFVFYYSNLFSSLLIFLTVVLFTSQLAQRSEIIAVLCSGVSFNRMLRPYMIGATILVGVSLYFTHYQLPKANKVRLGFEEQYIRSQFRIYDKNLHREIGPGSLVYFESFNYVNKMGFKFSLEQWNEEGRLTYKLIADRATYDSLSGSWKLNNYVARLMPSDSLESIEKGWQKDTLINLKPSDLGQRLELAGQMSWTQLNDYIAAERRKGSDKTVFYEIEKHQRTSYPFASYILTLIGVSIASRKKRGGTGINLALGVLLAFIYIFAMKITTVAATNAGLNPLLAVWLPNMLFALVSVWLYFKAQK